MFKNVLILGSAGQIGTHLKKVLLKHNYNVIEFDIENSYTEDLRIKGSVEYELSKCDFVMFAAFDVGGSYYLEKYQHTYDFINNNILIMQNTFELLKKYNKPFIFMSTQMSNMIDSPYGVLKTVGEFYTKSLNGLFIKFWNVYGIEKDEEKSHVITDFIRKAKKFNHIVMRTNGEESREFLHADDASECLIKIMENYYNIDRNKNLHISSFKQTKILDLAKIIATIFNCTYEPNPYKIDDIQHNRNNKPDDYILQFWQPKIELVDGIHDIINLIK